MQIIADKQLGDEWINYKILISCLIFLEFFYFINNYNTDLFIYYIFNSYLFNLINTKI